jgi:hypothetical protein
MFLRISIGMPDPPLPLPASSSCSGLADGGLALCWSSRWQLVQAASPGAEVEALAAQEIRAEVQEIQEARQQR